jgi:hypothetical protein
MSRAAAALLRALLARAGVGRDRILLSEVRSVDWRSLTFTGEQHSIRLRLCGADAEQALARLTDGIEDAEFVIAGQIVGDIRADRCTDADGVCVAIEALTIAE